MKPILMVCAETADAVSARAAITAALNKFMSPPERSRNSKRAAAPPPIELPAPPMPLCASLDQPDASERSRQGDAVAIHFQARLAAARKERFGLPARKCIAGERRGGGDFPQLRGERGPGA